MKVKELIIWLSNLDPEMPVKTYIEHPCGDFADYVDSEPFTESIPTNDRKEYYSENTDETYSVVVFK